MSQSNRFQPNWASTPGDTISDILKSKEISLSHFAELMNSNIENIRKLLHGGISITEDIAEKLHKILGASIEFWLNRENQYRETTNRLNEAEEKKWIDDLPVKEMIEAGWIKKTSNIIKECLTFFDTPDVWTWKKDYSNVIALTAFRKSNNVRSSSGSIAAWLRQAEIKSQEIVCNDWNLKLFQEKLIEIRSLTKKKDPKDFIPLLQSICAECGVAVIILRAPAGCPASGATKFITDKKAMILLSFRYLSDDQFWFTFFHEAGHLILHSNKSLFIEEENNKNKEEEEANNFSAEILLPGNFQGRLRTMRPSQVEIKRLSKDADISMGIIVGQLQHLKRLDPSYMNYYKRNYKLTDIMELSR